MAKATFVLVALLFNIGVANAENCKIIVKDLINDYGRIQERGGIWALFERSAALKEKSMLGMQVDSKLRRTISVFENYCEIGSKKATVALAKQISTFIDKGRMLNNNSSDRVPAKKFIADVQSLIRDTDAFLNNLEK